MEKIDLQVKRLVFNSTQAKPTPSGGQKAVDVVDTYQFSHSKDWVAGKDKIEGAKYMNTGSDKNQTHWIEDFTDQIKNLPTGKYKIEKGKVVPY